MIHYNCSDNKMLQKGKDILITSIFVYIWEARIHYIYKSSKVWASFSFPDRLEQSSENLAFTCTAWLLRLNNVCTKVPSIDRELYTTIKKKTLACLHYKAFSIPMIFRVKSIKINSLSTERFPVI